jgi:hypothetical protein
MTFQNSPGVLQKNVHGSPSIIVSAKGVVNGLSDIINGGSQFGPDTMLGATSPNQTGAPYTQTLGMQEAANYAAATGTYHVKLMYGTYVWQGTPTAQITQCVNVPEGVTIKGSGIDKTIITITNSTDAFNIPFALNSHTRITGMTFNMQNNNNSSYTPDAIYISNPSQYVEIDHNKFINQATAWFIQFQATFNSSSPPSGYIEKVRIHNNIINANIPSGTSANECVGVSNSRNVDIYNNTFIADGSNMTNGFYSIYDYSRHTHVYNNRFIIYGTAHSPVMNFSDTYDAYFENNTIVSNNTTGPSVIGIQNSSKYVYIRDNMIIGPLTSNIAGFSSLIILGLGANAVENGSGGPDGNVSQNAGWNDYIVIKDNYVVGILGLFQFAFSGNQNFNYLEVSGNTFGTLREYGNPFTYASQNNGIFIYRNNMEIGDIIAGAGAVGIGTAQLDIAMPSGYTLQQAIIEGNRFPNATDFASTTAFNNTVIQNVQNLIFKDNIMYNNSTITSPTSLASWYQLSGITAYSRVHNYDGASGKVLEQMFAPTTPAVPSTGTPQQNTNQFPVEVALYGGTVTEIQITRNGTLYTVFSTATGIALAGQGYRLDPGDSITVTYTAAPTWIWLPA